jgi:hypothetical protein
MSALAQVKKNCKHQIPNLAGIKSKQKSPKIRYLFQSYVVGNVPFFSRGIISKSGVADEILGLVYAFSFWEGARYWEDEVDEGRTKEGTED